MRCNWHTSLKLLVSVGWNLLLAASAKLTTASEMLFLQADLSLKDVSYFCLRKRSLNYTKGVLWDDDPWPLVVRSQARQPKTAEAPAKTKDFNSLHHGACYLAHKPWRHLILD